MQFGNMRCHGFWARMLLAFGMAGFGAAVPVASADQLLDSFVAHLGQLESVPADRRNAALEQVEQWKADSVADAITEALVAMYPGYEEAIEATDGSDAVRAISLLEPLSSDADPFLAADAAFFLARTLMNDERFETALPLLTRLGREAADHSAHLPTIQYYRGVALAGLLKNEEAVAAFMEFLQFNPDAPERLRVNAWRQVQQLQAAGNSKMGEVQQRMDFSRRRLRLNESGEQTQQEQAEIVKLLTEMIKEQQKKECSASNSKSSNTKQQQQQTPQQQQAQNNSPQSSEGQQGGSSSNPNGVAERTYDNSPASPWSRLRDRSRDPANSAIKEKLPARYREIVERYYEKANGDDRSKGDRN